jgi:hypothetical protein
MRRCLPCPPPRAGSQTEELPDRLPSPLINLAPRRLLNLLHSLKWPVLNFHRRRSVASSDPSPRRPDAIKGVRSHGHFTHSVLPHLAPLIRAQATQHQAPTSCSIPLCRRRNLATAPPDFGLGVFPVFFHFSDLTTASPSPSPHHRGELWCPVAPCGESSDEL